MEGEHPDGQTLRQRFTAFFESWLVRQRSYLEQLKALSEKECGHEDSSKVVEMCMHLVEQVLGHYKEYYEEKVKAANDDVFLMLSPPWFSSFERTLFWVSGFKPSLIIQLVTRVVGDLSAEQIERIEFFGVEIKNMEREIGESMAKVQESLAAPPLLELARREGMLVDGEVSDLDAAMEELKRAMVVVMGRADTLRGAAVREVLNLLNPMQKVKFLAGKAHFWIQVRKHGMERNGEVETGS